jgi:general stress protein 26
MTVREKAERLYKGVNTLILTCVGGDGYPMTKAVVPGKYRESLDELFFCTNTSSNFAAAVARDGKASVYFYMRFLLWKGCMLKGEMQIVTDMAVKKKYWQDKFRNAYPEKSYTDPDFCVLRFVPASGRYYAMYRADDFTI